MAGEAAFTRKPGPQSCEKPGQQACPGLTEGAKSPEWEDREPACACRHPTISTTQRRPAGRACAGAEGCGRQRLHSAHSLS